MTFALHNAYAEMTVASGGSLVCALCSGDEAKAKSMARTVPALPNQSKQQA